MIAYFLINKHLCRSVREEYLTSYSPFLDPCLRIVFSPLVIQALFLCNSCLLTLFLCLRTLASLVVGFHQPLLTLLLQSFLIELVIRDVHQRECRRFILLLLHITNILISGLTNRLVQLPDPLLQLRLVIEILSLQDALRLFLGSFHQLELQFFVVCKLLFLSNELLQPHFCCLLLQPPAAFLALLSCAG